jgi:hypothetical protein
MSDKVFSYDLVRYRDAGMPTYTYFWVGSDKRIASPYFNSEEEAHKWIDIKPRVQQEQYPKQKTQWVTDCE